MVQVWKDKRLVRMISTIHDARIVNTERKYRKTDLEINKPYAIVQYNKFRKGVDRADQYLSYYSILRKSVKWSKKVALRGLLEKYPTFGREKETGLLGALDN